MFFELTNKTVLHVENLDRENGTATNVIIQDGKDKKYFQCIEFWEEVTAQTLSPGDSITVKGFVNCRFYNGRYYTSLRGSEIVNHSKPQSPEPKKAPAPANDDLPF